MQDDKGADYGSELAMVVCVFIPEKSSPLNRSPGPMAGFGEAVEQAQMCLFNISLQKLSKEGCKGTRLEAEALLGRWLHLLSKNGMES